MSRKPTTVALILSLGLNVSFVAGFLWVGHTLRKLDTMAGRAEWGARKLRLDDAQREAFFRLHGDWRSTLRRIHDERKAEVDAFWTEAVKDDADPEAVRARLAPLLEAQRQATAQGTEHLLRLFRLLTPAQRDALVEMIRKKEKQL